MDITPEVQAADEPRLCDDFAQLGFDVRLLPAGIRQGREFACLTFPSVRNRQARGILDPILSRPFATVAISREEPGRIFLCHKDMP